MIKRSLFIILLFGCALHLVAFDAIGHKIIADIAYENLNCHARKKLDKLLGKRGMIYTSSWSDNIKSDSRYAYSYNWHFQNLREEMCKEALCQLYENPKSEGSFLFYALDSLRRNLKNKKGGEEDVKFIVHLVGDMFQPLHLGHLADRGGNDILIEWFGKETRLHQIWDKQMLQGEQYSYSEYSRYLQDKFAKKRKQIKKQQLQDALWVTYELSNKIYAYNYERLNSYRYVYEFTDDIDLQLYSAGIHLAKVLNRAL